METNKKLHPVALVSAALILFLIFVSPTASAQTEPEITSGVGDTSDEQVLSDGVPTEVGDIATESIQTALPKITETRITTNASGQQNPVIYGDKIVWEDDRNGNYDIYMYDLSTKKETQITTNASDQYLSDIYGNRIVWTDDRNEDSDIYVYDLSTKKEKLITTNSFGAWHSAIYGDRVVWTDSRNGKLDIYMYDLSTKKETQITTNESNQENPAIYDNKIVWTDDRNGYYDIYMYDLSTKKETQITTNESDQENPAIYGNRIVWQDDRNGDWDIYMYDLSTKKETQITNNGGNESPAIYGDRITWYHDRNSNVGIFDIYMYDLSTNTETQITTSGEASDPDIYDGKIVWQDGRNGNSDIYMATLPVVADFSASPTSGKAPLTVSFTDKSIGTPTKWKWSFGDGTTSTQQNPTHKYSKVGRYTVKLTATNAEGSNTATKTDYIKVVTKPVASFSAKPTSGKVPLTVAFTDKSTGVPTKWKWSFGDGKTSTVQNPKHQYLQEGKYKVTLTVSNVAGGNTVTKTNYITVTTNTRPGIHSESE